MFNTEKLQVVKMLDEIGRDCKQVGREIYYAMTFLDNTHPARANLRAALKILGCNKPGDVGLSDRILEQRNK